MDDLDIKELNTAHAFNAKYFKSEYEKIYIQNQQIISALESCVSQCSDYENMTEECAAAFRNARALILKIRG